MKCAVDICTRGHYAKGFCQMHYARLKKGHNPMVDRTIFEMTEKERFLSKVSIASENECWPWAAGVKSRKTDFNYGSYYFRSKRDLAHRVSYILFHGDIPDGMFVCHRCDNPVCVNPNHLFLGLPVDNTQDKFLKGRANMPKGEQRSKKFKDSDIISIREMAKSKSHQEIASAFNVSRATICDIVSRRTWKHL